MSDVLQELRSRVGTVLGPTAWRRVEQSDIDTFARLSGDRQWIHTDVERAARESPYGTTIAHGNLTLALVDGFRDELFAVTEDAAMGVNMGYDRVRFPAPVLSGSDVRATLEVVSVRERDAWIEVVQRFVLEVRGAERPCCVADSIVRVLPRPV